MKKQILIILINLLAVNFGHSQFLKKLLGTYAPIKTDTSLVRNIIPESYQEVWQFPDAKTIDTARIEYNIFGATRGYDLTRAIEKVEPPAIVNMQVLKNKNILVICPKEFRRNNMPYNLNIYKKCNHFIPSNIDVYLLNNENGEVIWKTNLKISGVFETMENDNYIFILSVDYDELTNISDQKITVLSKASGELVWQSGGKKTNSILLSNNKERIIITEKDTLSEGTTFAYALKNNSVSLLETIPDININFKPIIKDRDLFYLKENFLISYNIENQKANWQYKIDSTLYNNKIYLDNSFIYLVNQNKITSLNINNGNEKWRTQKDYQNIIGISSIGDQLLLFELFTEPIKLDKKTKKLTNKKLSPTKFHSRYKKSVLYSIDIPTVKKNFRITSVDFQGNKEWEFMDNGEVMSNIKTKDTLLLFATYHSLYAINNITGELIKKLELSDNSELSLNDICILDDKIIVRNEKFVYCFNAENYQLLYQHEFDLVWPTLTTTEITKDNMGGAWIMNNVLQPDGADRHTQLLMQSSQNFTRWGNSMNQSNLARNNNTLSASQRTNTAIEAYSGQMAALVGLYQMNEAAQIRKLIDTYKAQLMCQPYLLYETNNITIFDNDRVTIRLVNKIIEEQKFVALELLEMKTGTVKTQVLSPFQFREYYYTWYRNPTKIWSYLGYVPVLNLKDHVLRTTIDWESGMIYHYGPGLDVDTYKYYEEKYGFIRGKVICVPFNFKIEKNYL